MNGLIELAKGLRFMRRLASGQAAAPLLARVLLGESPAAIPMANVSVNTTKFNRDSVKRLGLPLSPAVLRELESTVARAALSAPGRSIRAADIEFLHGHAIQGVGAGHGPLGVGHDDDLFAEAVLRVVLLHDVPDLGRQLGQNLFYHLHLDLQ